VEDKGGGGIMRDIAKLLFGDDARKVPGLFGAGGGGESGMAERARRAGEWCGTTPGRGSAATAARTAARPGRAGRQATIRVRNR
jgi:hypothetical protein